ncbi:YqiA/YcfP family alpha/beta fold hydrolase [Psychrobacter fulvigenes]|uniref:YqiA/YcfP family alpha/beta fold hydrolase n=1 Tax=Psychrobacter fulvigenes TaxID=533323 RepID=UPI00191A61DC|nr:YqiA/YcfP family alpha/beta fold hydrolase [Psychrobacter fulvigenes]
MNIIYIHGLDSGANSTKGILLENYCQQYHPDINVVRPDLNKTPDQVFRQILSLIESLNNNDDAQLETSNMVLVGSSLGGYFSTLVSNHIDCPALLLNPSTQPHVTLQRFADESILARNDRNEVSTNKVLYTTAGGWNITYSDLQWFAEHQLAAVNYPNKIAVLIKEGDELLDPNLSAKFYQQHGAKVILQAEGDHRFSDFGEQLPMVIDMLRQLL